MTDSQNNADGDNREYDHARRAWRTDAQWTQLRARAEASTNERPIPAWRRYSGALIAASLLIAATAIWRIKSDANVVEWKVTENKAGGRVVVQLADSSVVTLGPASKIRYAMNSKRREIELTGLANFNVVHDAKRPFTVKAAKAIATDVGTEFVMRAYESDSAVRVSVTSGVVSLVGNTSKKPLELVAGKSGVVRLAAKSSGEAEFDAGSNAFANTAWTKDQLVFTDETFASASVEIGRWFDVDIHVADSTLSKRHVTAVYTSPTLSGVLDALSATLGAHYERNGRTITIQPVKPK